MKHLTLGVLGGMGPQATVDFMAKLVEATPVDKEQDHLRVLVDSNAKVPDRNKAIAGTGPTPGPVLAAMAVGLQRSGADFIVMACNTAHAFEADIRDAVSVPFISMVEEAADACRRDHAGARRVGLLAAPGCIASGLYQRALAQRGLEVLLLPAAEQARFNALLYRIKLNEPLPGLKPEMKALGQVLIDAGADLLLAGCTEVPLVLAQGDLPRPLLDATWNLAQRCVLYARGLAPLPGSHNAAT
ncbi:MAG: amino acid racemase [Burkholderiaceae bacterium]|nr:amino acid racemase [Burkholderiaceae bacterium]